MPPSNTLPRYVQISEFLIREIAAGRLLAGNRLPPEREMAADLGVSVGTLRKALADLQKKGLLERIQGSGNYIRQGNAADSVYAMFRLELIGGGGLPRADVLGIDAMTKPDDLPPFGTSQEATRVRRLRRLNETIVAVEEIWLDADAGQIIPDQLSDSLYQYYRSALGLWISRAEDQVSVAPVPDWAPREFGLAPRDVTGFIERQSWTDAPGAIEYSRTWFDTNHARYVQRLK